MRDGSSEAGAAVAKRAGTGGRGYRHLVAGAVVAALIAADLVVVAVAPPQARAEEPTPRTFSVERISLDAGGAEATRTGFLPAAVSPDGQKIAFPAAFAPDASMHLWLRDRSTGAVAQVSTQRLGWEDASHRGDPAMSADARHVAWVGEGIGGSWGDDSCGECIYERDLTTSTAVPHRPVPELYRQFGYPSMSDDGATLVFLEYPPNHVRGRHQLWLRGSDGVIRGIGFSQTLPAGGIHRPQISGDGTTLVHHQRNDAGEEVVRVRNLTDGWGGDIAVLPARRGQAISADAQTVVYVHPEGGLAVWDRSTRTVVERIAADAGRQLADPVMSADGTSIAFVVEAGSDPETGAWQLSEIRHVDRSDGPVESRPMADTTLISAAPDGTPRMGMSASISADGSTIVFASAATDLDPAIADTNGAFDYYAAVLSGDVNTPPDWPGEDPVRVAELTRTSVTLEWDEAQDDGAVAAYEVSLDGELVAELGPDVRTYTIDDLVPGTGYTVAVQPVDDLGRKGPGRSLTIRTEEPEIGTGTARLTVTSIDSGRVELDWGPAAAEGLTGYRVVRSREDGPFETVTEVDATKTGYVDSRLDAATTYRYRVQELRGDAVAPHTVEATITTPALAPIRSPSVSYTRLDWSSHARLDSNVVMSLSGDAGREATASVTWRTWYDEAGDLLDAPRTVVTEERLVERFVGSYSGSFRLGEGITEVVSIGFALADEAGSRVTMAAQTYAVPVAGRLEIEVDAPQDSLPGAMVVVRRDGGGGGQGSVTGGGTVTVPLRPADDYRVELRRGDGVVGAELDGVEVRPGLVSTATLAPTLASRLAIRVTDAAGTPRAGQRINVRNAATGQVIGTRLTGSDGRSSPFERLDAGTTLELDVPVGDREQLARVAQRQLVLPVGSHVETVVLEPLPVGRLAGRVTDPDGEPVALAQVTARQQVDGRSWSSSVRTDADGVYAVDVLAGTAEVTASAVLAGPALTNVEIAAGTTTELDLQLLVRRNYRLTFELYTQLAGHAVMGPLPIDWRTGVHLRLRSELSSGRSWSVRDETSWAAAVPGETVRFCADGVEAGLPAGCASAVLGEDTDVTVKLSLAQAGLVEGTLQTVSGDPFTVTSRRELILVGPDGGRRVVYARSSAGSRFEIPVLEVGSYEVRVSTSTAETAAVPVTIAAGQTVDLGPLTLRPSGPFTRAPNGVVALRPDVAPGGLAEFRTVVSNTGAAAVTGAIVTLDVPPGSSFEPTSLLRDGQPADADPVPAGVEIALGELAPGDQTILRHSVRLEPGVDNVTAMARLRWDGAANPVVVGSATSTVSLLTLDAPRSTIARDIVVSGRAPAGANVEVREGSLLLGAVEASPGGVWRLALELPDRGSPYRHLLEASVAVDGDTLLSGVREVHRDADGIEVTQISLRQDDGALVSFDPRLGTARFPYTFVPGRRLNVAVTFDDPDRADDVEVQIGSAAIVRAERGSDGRFHVSMNVPSNAVGDIYVEHSTLARPFDLNDGSTGPSDVEVRDRLPAAVAGAVVVGSSERRDADGTYHATASFRLPDLGDAPLDLDLTVRRSQHLVTEEDVEFAERSGVPIYGVEVQGGDPSSQLVLRIPVDALGGDDPEAAATDMVAQLLFTSSTAQGAGAVGTGGDTAYDVTPARVATLVDVFDVAVGMYDVEQAINGLAMENNKYVKIDRLESRARQCAPHLLPRIEAARNRMLVHDGFAVGLLLIGLPSLGLAPPLGVAFSLVGLGAGKWFEFVDGVVMKEIAAELDLQGCQPDQKRRPDARPVWIYDPSGYVYEGLPDVRLEGVTATILFAEHHDGPFEVWDAEWFGQVNPQTTNAEGRYGWDVPEGYWQVLWEFDGYASATSDVLRVLPPHLDVNASLRRLAPPELSEAAATGGDEPEVTFGFDVLMEVASVDVEHVRLRDAEGEPIAGIVEPIDAGTDPDGRELARRFRFVPSGPIEVGSGLELAVAATVRSYAEVSMLADEARSLTAVARPPDPGTDPDPEPGSAHVNKTLAAVRQATTAYRQPQVARDDGFEPSGECKPGVGLYYVRDVPQEARHLDPLAPNVLVYAPGPQGNPRLVGVAWAAWDAEDSKLLGQALTPPDTDDGPLFWTLHAWVWQGNPEGTFAPTHKGVRC